MKDYKRLTDKEYLNKPKCFNCEHNYSNCSTCERHCVDGDCFQLREELQRLVQLEDKIENARTVEIHYKPPFETKYAIVEYYARQGKPLKVAEYNIYGEELKTGKQLICWEYLSSTNFSVIENGFDTKAEAEKKLKMLKGGVK